MSRNDEKGSKLGELEHDLEAEEQAAEFEKRNIDVIQSQ